MIEQVARELHTADVVAPIVFAAVFVLGMSLVPEPTRQRFNAIFVAGAGAAYLNGGLGLWEFGFTAIATALAYLGLRSHRFIGLAWLGHSCWDVVHHLYGAPIVFFAPTSSAGCAITDALIALWFLAGAPSLLGLRAAQDAGASSSLRRASSQPPMPPA